MSENQKAGEFVTTTLFGQNTQQPLVSLTYEAKGFHVQMFPEEAISLGNDLISVAQASLTDAFLVDFARKRMGSDERMAAILMLEFREWRKRRGAGA